MDMKLPITTVGLLTVEVNKQDKLFSRLKGIMGYAYW